MPPLTAETCVYWAAAYLLGGIPFGLLIGLAHGVDIRNEGSRNIGATNLGRTLGKPWGVLAFLLDAGKGWGAVQASRLLTESFATDSAVPVIAAVLAIVGHCYSPFLRFGGGKGVATAAGGLFALSWMLSASLIAVWIVGVLVIGNIGVASSLSAAGALIVGAEQIRRGHVSFGVMLIVVGALIIYRHRRNLVDFARGRGGRSGVEPIDSGPVDRAT